MKIGYARVSTLQQQEALQVDALRAAGCERIFVEKMSGKAEKWENRSKLAQALGFLRQGDTFVVWRLDRVGRSLPHLIQFTDTLHARGIEFMSLTEAIDTSTPTGRLVFHLFAALAEFERDLTLERSAAGRAAARARGKLGGRPKSLSPLERERLYTLYMKGEESATELCALYKVSRATLYKYVKEIAEAKEQQKKEQQKSEDVS